ncbi:MAG: beta-propeller domain-containing protein [Kofleriaceae bacterium]|nr:beta-propeller domain-containing protein [Myxococcales bacterium]MCB9564647.1 beta-propeller domain-containing protein [Kofleriaceae bacterium]MCB9573759.1 beta-propeller domain-containing protein [Kofleriaceae bacterium]
MHAPRIPTLTLAVALALPVAAVALPGCADEPTTHSTTQLVQYQSCGALEADLKQMMIDEIWAEIDQWGQWGGPLSGGEDGDAADPSSDGGREEGTDYSGTNNQEDGVDEADFVKTDGYHIYTLNGNRLHIFGVPEFGDLVPESVTEIEGHPTQMLIDRDAGRAVVFSVVPVWNLPEDHPLRPYLGDLLDDGSWMWRTWDVTKITVLDVADRTAPTLVREVFLEGWYQTARKHDSSIRLATYAWMNNPVLWQWWQIYDQLQDPVATKIAVAQAIHALSLEDLVPRYYVRTPDGDLAPNQLTTAACASFYRPTDSQAYGMTSLYSLDLASTDLAIDSDNVVSNWPTVYASDDTLVLTEPAHGWWWFWRNGEDPEQLNVHAFDITTPGQTHYLASGRVDGLLFDQFSIDEEADTIRLATTDNRWARWWQEDAPPPDNHVWVLARHGSRLETIGHVGGIAPDESIQAARFVGDRAFLVTFQQIDPLFTIDLRDPTAPRVVGELQVPGFSTYLHVLADGRLLAIGIGADDQANARWGLTQVSLFDTSDFAHPALQDTLQLEAEGEWTWSEALWEHKAFQYWAPEELLAVPVSSYQELGDTDGDGYNEWRYLSRLELVNVSLTDGLSLKGTIDHSDLYTPDDYWYYRDVRRTIFMGDYLYAISDRGITVHRTADLGLVTMQGLPGYTPDDWYWWW